MKGRPGRRHTRLAIAVLGTLVAVLLVGCGGDGSDKSLTGYRVEPVPHVGGFTVDNASNGEQPFQLRADPGRLLIVFLGFTNCPDVCPTALAEVNQVINRLGDDAEPLDVAMLTVDPARDTPEVLNDYVGRIVDGGIALRTTDPATLQQVATAFGATFETAHDHAGNTTQVGHTDQTYLVDASGDVIVTWTAAMTTDDLEHDLRIVLDSIGT